MIDVNTAEELKHYEFILRSGLTNLLLDIEFPYQAMYDEVSLMFDKFVTHRSYDSEGWKSLTLYGAGSDITVSTDNSDYRSYSWTDVSKQLPASRSFFEKTFVCKPSRRIRFMMLEPNGYIAEHKDFKTNTLDSAVNFSLNHPTDCEWYLNDYLIPWSAGQARLLNLTNKHYVMNKSNERRIMMIYHGLQENKDNPEWKRLVIKSFNKWKSNSLSSICRTYSSVAQR